MTIVSLRMPDALVQRIDAVASAATASQAENVKVQRTHIVIAAVTRALPFMEASYGLESSGAGVEAPNPVGRPRTNVAPRDRVPGWLVPHVQRLGVDDDAMIARDCGKSPGSVRYWRVLLS